MTTYESRLLLQFLREFDMVIDKHVLTRTFHYKIVCSLYITLYFKCVLAFQDVHETAAGALWNLAFNPGNALRIVEEGGVPALVHLCSSSVSKMARFMAALALAYMFDGRY